MAVSKIKATFTSNIQKVWQTVTDVADYPKWRSDLRATSILNEKQFVEYTKNGYATTFSITRTEPCKRGEFDMENSNMKGHWIGVFTQKGEQTEVCFTEDVAAKKFWMKPFVKRYLTKQQEQFIADLKIALQNKA